MLEGISPGWLALAGGVLGAILGSFIAALCIRWPQGRSVLHGRSSCDHCDHIPRPYELVPVLSWIFLGGKCSRCKTAIDPVHPVAEMAGAAIGAAAFLLLPVPQAVGFALFGWLALPLILLDFRHHWLPDRLTLVLALAGIGVTAWLLPHDLVMHIATGLLGFIALEGIRIGYRRYRQIEGMGAGDPKLFGAIALWAGPYPLPVILLLASGGGLIWYLLARSRAPERFPFGALLLLATLAVLPFRLA